MDLVLINPVRIKLVLILLEIRNPSPFCITQKILMSVISFGLDLGRGFLQMCLQMCVCMVGWGRQENHLVVIFHWLPSTSLWLFLHTSLVDWPPVCWGGHFRGFSRSQPSLEIWTKGPSSVLKTSRVIWHLASAGITQVLQVKLCPMITHSPTSLLVFWKLKNSIRNNLLFYLCNTKGFLHAG